MTTQKKVVITGAAGQDGLILGIKLVNRGFQVHGVVRNQDQVEMVTRINPGMLVSILDSSNPAAVTNFLEKQAPDFIYHLSARSSVANSWEESEQTMEVNVFHTLNWLNGINKLEMKEARLYHASSSEMFGLPKEYPQNENTLLHPRSPYGVSKVAAHHLVVNYRESYGLFASTGILFNHESPLRNPTFVTRKITKGVASIAKGLSDSITLGNTEVSRDWGWAPDYVEGMISILEHDQPDDFVLATGVSHSLKDFISMAFSAIGVIDWETMVKSDHSLFRPAEVVSVVGDSSKARRILGWKPTETFEGMIKKMVKFDLDLIENKSAYTDWRPE
jgi:GDPmannose 4,6-dehydratase